MSTEERNLKVVVLDLYHDDIVMTAAPDWVDPGPWVGKEQVARSEREWASAWEQLELAPERVEAAPGLRPST